MIDLEERLLSRWSGRSILLGSLVAGICGVAPIVLYATFGPEDGNPVGLGLLAMLAVPVAGTGLLVGLIKMVIEFFVRGGR